MNVPLYEKLWMWASGALIAAFIATIVVGLAGSALQPPSHVETIDPTTVWNDPRFKQRGVTTTPEGATVVMIAMMFAFQPAEIRVPAGKPARKADRRCARESPETRSTRGSACTHR